MRKVTVEDLDKFDLSIYRDVDKLITRFKVKEAYELLMKRVKPEMLNNNLEVKYYYYYLSRTLLLGFHKNDEALKCLMEVEERINWEEEDYLIDLLIENTIGIALALKNNKKEAKKYFDISIEKILSCKILPEEKYNEAILILYNSAKFYSSLKQNSYAIDLCILAVSIAKGLVTFKHLDKVYYEMAFNYAEIGKKEKAANLYIYAYTFSNLNNNSLAKKVIREDAKKFGINLEIDLN